MTTEPITPATTLGEVFDIHAADDVTILSAKPDQQGWLFQSPGLKHVALCTSSISRIDGATGVLRYRGMPIDDVIDAFTFDTLVPFLAFDEPATDGGMVQETLRTAFTPTTEIKRLLGALPFNTDPINVLAAVVSALPAIERAVLGDRPHQHQRAAFVMAQIAAAATYWARQIQGLDWIEPTASWETLAEAVCIHLHPGTPAGQLSERIDALDVVLKLHAEHEMNCSTTAVRTAASAGTDLYTAILAGLAAFKGPRHGGASAEVAAMYASLRAVNLGISTYIADTLVGGERLPGFGHRVYRCTDPRAAIMIGMLRDGVLIRERDPVACDLALRLVDAVANHQFFQKRNIHPNPDLVNGLLFQAIGFPAVMNPAVLCISRVLGWIAHWIEETGSTQPIIRPRQITSA